MMILTSDKIIKVETIVTESDRVVDFQDILDSVSVNYDEYMDDAPWDNCDGWEHSVRSIDHDGERASRGCYHRDRHNNGIIEIDDSTITDCWGHNGYPGCSKQVRAELIAQVKRNALDQLVKWYEEGWSYYSVQGEYDGYEASIHGIDDYGYADSEVREDIASEIAYQMESDGYIIENLPLRKEYIAVDNYRQRKEWLNKSYVVNGR